MANEELPLSVSDKYFQDRFTNGNSACAVGRYAGAGEDGALRFTSVDIDKDQSLNMCYLFLKYGDCGTSGGTWKFNVIGIDEDNTGSFGYPFGRPQTTAINSRTESAPTSGDSLAVDVKSIVAEITSRSGWSNGNALGFLLFENGSDDDTWTTFDDSNCYLIYRYSAEPDFTPTVTTLSAPSLPTAEDYGVKISKPGISVLEATEAQTYYTSRKKRFFVKSEGQVTTGANPHTIAHGLSYIPFAEVFAKSGTEWFRLPFKNYSGGSNVGYVEINDTNVVVYAGVGTVIYYYIFNDQLAT